MPLDQLTPRDEARFDRPLRLVTQQKQRVRQERAGRPPRK